MLNKYIIRSRISEAKFREILRFFCLDLEANKITEISGISRNSTNKNIQSNKSKNSEFYKQQTPLGIGEIEIDESSFGARRVLSLSRLEEILVKYLFLVCLTEMAKYSPR